MRFVTRVSPQFDICYALADLASPHPTAPHDWLSRGADEPDWLVAARRFGWGFWLGVPDVLENAEPAASVAEFIETVARLAPDVFLSRMRRALFHVDSEDPVPADKREWLYYIGIDADPGPDPTRAVLRGGAVALHAAAVDVLRGLEPSFDALWRSLLPQLHQSAERVDRLAQVCTPGELAQHLLLKAEFDSAKRRIRALRGGYALAFDDVTQLYLMPSVFNTRRFWNAADETLPATLFFPYFDAAIAIPPGPLGLGPNPGLAEYDPWLVCRALGDPNRAAIVRGLARRPQTATELIETLGLSKATVSHHIFTLREAGLIGEERRGRSILLSLRGQALDQLSPALRRELTAHGQSPGYLD